jgi:hypothetical protein
MVITIEGKEYNLEYNNRQLFAIEKQIDKPIIKILQDEDELGKLSTMYTIIYCGIKETITFDYFIDNLELTVVNTIIEDALKLVMGAFETGVKKKVVEAS